METMEHSLPRPWVIWFSSIAAILLAVLASDGLRVSYEVLQAIDPEHLWVVLMAGLPLLVALILLPIKLWQGSDFARVGLVLLGLVLARFHLLGILIALPLLHPAARRYTSRRYRWNEARSRVRLP